MKTNKRKSRPIYEPPWKYIDPGIRKEVRILWENGIHTTESCEGSKGHSFSEPTVRITGVYADGLRALAVALTHGLKVSALRRAWTIIDGEPVGPEWEMVFSHQDHGMHPVISRDGICHHFEWR